MGAFGAIPAVSQTVIQRSRDIEVDTESDLPEFEESTGSQTETVRPSASKDSPSVSEGSQTEPTDADATTTTPPKPEQSVEFAQPQQTTPPATRQASAPNQSSIARYNIRHNVCNGNWSISEIRELFPEVTAEMVRDVCR